MIFLKLIFVFLIFVKALDYYQILEVSEDADESEIKKAFRKLSKFHPDRNPGNEEIHKKYIEITKAYEVLSSPEKRQIYDIYGEEGVNDQEKFNKKKGSTSRFNIEVDLEDAYNGVSKEITIKRNEICKKCKGTGAKDKRIVKCSMCDGKGMRPMQPGAGMKVPCDRCGQRGYFISEKCTQCKGSKVAIGSKTFSIEIEPGMDNGSEIVFEGQGEQNPELFPGDLVYVVRVKSHPRFVRHGSDLAVTIKLTLRESLLGYKRQITHLDGHIVEVEHDGVTQPSSVRIIENEGMPHQEMHSQKGNLVINFEIDYPQKLTSEQAELVKQLLPN